MSYDIWLNDQEGQTCRTKNKHQEGGTYCVGGTDECSLNVTYNYAWFYYKFFDEKDGIRWLYGKKAKDCVQKLENCISFLGKDKYRDYWAPTPGNAGYALSVLLEWAKEHPNGIFQGD